MVMDPADELQASWLKTILVQMLDKETKLHVGEEIGKEGVKFEKAKGEGLPSDCDFLIRSRDQEDSWSELFDTSRRLPCKVVTKP